VTELPDNAVLVAGYIRYAEALGRGDLSDPVLDSEERAYTAVQQLIREGPARDAWQMVLALLRQAPHERLDVYAAGPLEDLVNCQGHVLIGEIEAEAACDACFRWALSCVWLDGGLPEDVRRRIRAAAEPLVEPPPN
jgi:hypothetical protein